MPAWVKHIFIGKVFALAGCWWDNDAWIKCQARGMMGSPRATADKMPGIGCVPEAGFLACKLLENPESVTEF